MARPKRSDTIRDPWMEAHQIGEKMSAARRACGMTMQAVADTGICGMSTLSFLENNRVATSLRYVCELCELYGTTLAAVLGGGDDASGDQAAVHAGLPEAVG